MSMKKYFRGNTTGAISPISGRTAPWNSEGFVPPDYTAQTQFGYKNYQYNLPEVYTGHPNRIERYNQYEAMDIDAEINSCLDILSEFSTQINRQNNTPFQLDFREDPTSHEVELLKTQLQQWCSLNEFSSRMFKIFRNVLKYGDQVFVRDPENFKLYWIDMVKVIKVIVNESKGKEPEQYVIKDINLNLENLTAAQKTSTDFSSNPITGMGGTGGGAPATSYTVPSMPYNTTGSRFTLGISESAVDAKHILHLSLTEGLDRFWPFGQSILETIFKVYKQKELLEDAVLIYRISRAPERRVFKIDVGNMPTHMAMAYVDRIKNEIHQRRIPSVHGGQANVDATYNPLCLDLDTRIPLLDGRTLALRDIISEFESGKENWAYSCDPVTGKVVPGVINWAGITRRNTDVIRVTLDNGKSFTCTPDHKIPVFGRGFVEAQNLTPADSLIAFETRNQPINGGKTNQYQQVWNHETREWQWTHRMVGEFFRECGKHQEFTYLPEYYGAEKAVIHHRDYDRFNNDPRNLQYMNKKDHILYHAANKREYWQQLSVASKDELTQKISQTVKHNWEILSDSERQTALYNIRAAQKLSVWMRQNDPDTAASYREKQSSNRRRYISDHPEFAHKLNRNLESRVKFSNQKLTLTFDMLQIVADTVKQGHTNKRTVMKLCSENKRLLDLVREHNSNMTPGVTQNKIDLDSFGEKKMNRLLQQFGYKNWRHFVSSIDNFNHRIVSIERVESRDTGTITIDGTKRWHDYHTFAIESGIFVKNSINEDYFFPVTAEGRGSSVDTLAGGQNLGEIDDLKYFNNKLARGLRVPSSYLPTGPDDSERTTNDGRLGTALIQEFRFNQYCVRLQEYIGRKLDQEFKLFLRWRGFNIDSGLFNLKFNEPQNFAAYRQVELDNARVNAFSTIEAYPYIAKRFALKRFLGLSEEEMQENDEMWQEENNRAPEPEAEGSDLRSIGISTSDIEGDIEAGEAAEGLEGGMPPPPELDITGPVAPPPPPPAGGPGGAPPIPGAPV